MNKSFLILTETGNNIGFGHLKRCISLQSKLHSKKLNCSIYVNIEGEYDFQNENYLISINWINNPYLMLPLVDDNSLVIIDSYIAPRKVYDFFTKKSIKTIVIDDFNRIDYGNVELILNPNPYFHKKKYKNQTISNFYGGRDFIILSTPFINLKKTKINFKNELWQICICLGGSDYKNILPKVLSQITLLNINNILVIVGNEEQERALSIYFDQFTIKYNLSSEEIYEVFQNSKLVISGCGQTLHELSSIGKKTIGICYDNDQTLNQEFYLNKSFLKYSIFAEDLSGLNQMILEEFQNDRKIHNTITSNGLENIYNLLIQL